MNKPKDQQEGHESEFQEQHSLTIYSTALTSPYTPTSETRTSGFGPIPIYDYCERLVQKIFQEDYVGGVPEGCGDGAAGLAGHYNFEEFW
jgi:hypothetical protein